LLTQSDCVSVAPGIVSWFCSFYKVSSHTQSRNNIKPTNSWRVQKLTSFCAPLHYVTCIYLEMNHVEMCVKWKVDADSKSDGGNMNSSDIKRIELPGTKKGISDRKY